MGRHQHHSYSEIVKKAALLVFGFSCMWVALASMREITATLWGGGWVRANLVDGTGDVYVTKAYNPTGYWRHIVEHAFFALVAATFGIRAVLKAKRRSGCQSLGTN